MDEYRIEFKDVLKDLRTRRGLSQKELADMLEINRSTFSMYENGQREADIKTLREIAEFFNVDMNILTGFTSMDLSKRTATPRGTDSAKIIQVIETKALCGLGTENDPVHIVTEHWDFEGKRLCRF